MKTKKNLFPGWMKAALAATLLALLAGGAWFYKVQEQEQRRQVEGQLQAIARLKADQIANWRKERLDDAAVLMDRLALVADAKRWLTKPAARSAEEILRRFRSLREHYRYHDLLLVDLDGKVRLSLTSYAGTHHRKASEALVVALRDRQPVFTDLHIEQDYPNPHVGVVAPLFANHGEAPKPLGAVILVSAAREFLYPMLQSWPVPSQTAETLLVRRDGDDALVLNDIRFHKDAALKLRIPLSRTDVPAVMAVLGKEGFVQGKALRGVDVVAVIKPIPDSPWFMVAKVDAAEAFAVWRFRSVLILALLLGFVVLAGAAGLVVWQRNQKAHYRALYRAEAELRASVERHSITLKAIGDAVIATDSQGRVELLNWVAEALTGWKNEEARGRPLEQVFCIVNEETQDNVENPVARVLREGLVVGLANHTLLIARDGTERPIADSGAPIRDEQGNITGVVLVFRDQTEERRAEKALRQSEEKYQILVETTNTGFLILNAHGKVIDANQDYVRLTGHDTLEEILGRTVVEWTAPYDLERNAREVEKCAAQGFVRNLEIDYVSRSGQITPIEINASVVGSGDSTRILSLCRDITERKQAEEELVRTAREWQTTFDAANDAIWILSQDQRILRCNKTSELLFQCSHEDLIGKHCWEIVHHTAQPIPECPILRARHSLQRETMELQVGQLWFQITVDPILDATDGYAGAVHIISDITDRKRAEETLRQHEATLRTILTAAPIGIALGKNRVIEWANDSFTRITGYVLEELEGQSTRLLYDNDEEFFRVGQVLYDHEEIRKQGVSRIETRFRRKDGEVIDVFISLAFVDRSRLDEGYVVSVMDITVRKKAEEALLKEKALSETIINSLPGVFYLFDDQGRLLRWNRNFEQVSGYTAEECARLGALDLFEGEDRTVAEQKIREVLAEGESTGEGALLSKDGRKTPYFFTGRRLELDGRLCLVGMGVDITARKEAEELVHNLIAWSPVGVYLLQDDRFLMVNQWFQTITGYSQQELSQKVPLDLVHLEDRRHTKEHAIRMLTGDSKAPYQYRITSRMGETRWIMETVAPIQWKGKRATLGFFLDITATKKIEEQLRQAQKMESIGTLAGGIAHDFNNILSPIMGYAELALYNLPENSPLRNDIKEILQGTKRASDLVKQILAFSRQSGQELKPLKAQLIIKEVLKLIRSLIPTTIEVKQDISTKCGYILADPTQIHQIAMNLMTNAYHAMEDEGGKLEVTLKEVELGIDDLTDQSMTPGAYVCLTVADIGHGMDQSVISRIFEPYFTTKETGKGTGLGLAVVHGIVKSYNGDIKVYSEPGKGTAFHVYLPVIKSQVETERADGVAPVPKGKERILLVDDEEPIVRLEKQMLERLGYQVAARTSSIEALEAFRAAPDKFDLVITDMTMPNMTGVQLSQKLLEIRPDIPIIICTGFSTKIDDEKAKEFGIRGFVMKPVVMSELAKKIRELLDKD